MLCMKIFGQFFQSFFQKRLRIQRNLDFIRLTLISCICQEFQQRMFHIQAALLCIQPFFCLSCQLFQCLCNLLCAQSGQFILYRTYCVIDKAGRQCTCRTQCSRSERYQYFLCMNFFCNEVCRYRTTATISQYGQFSWVKSFLLHYIAQLCIHICNGNLDQSVCQFSDG